jgi:D-arabinose 1-dehydrogenase-like Zn-dependent alcohol dehydrogenase
MRPAAHTRPCHAIAQGPGEVLLRVDVAGLCHSDLHILDGMFMREAAAKKAGRAMEPLALSHEIGGTVISLGVGVDSLTVGKQYVLYPWLGCGSCIQCSDPSSDEIFCMGRTRNYGVSNNGGFASHLIVPDPKYLVDPGDCELPLAATYTCSGLTAFSAVRKASLAMQGTTSSPTTAGRFLLIIGAGGLGLHGIGWAKILTDVTVVVAEPDTTKHAAAKDAGADVVIDTSGDDALDLLREATGGGPHAVIDFVGMPATSGLGRDALRKGGTQVQVGLFGGPMQLDVGSFATAHKHLMGNFVGSLDEFNELMEYVRSGEKKDIPCETRPIEAANEAIADLRAGTIVGRCVLTHAPREPSL